MKKNIYLVVFAMLLITLLPLTITSCSKNNSNSQKKLNKKKSSRSHPDWVKYSWNYKIVQNKKQKDPNASNYYKFQIYVKYTNNSQDKTITSISNSKIRLSFDQTFDNNIIGSYKSDIQTYSKIFECNIPPGESYKITYNIPFDRFQWNKKYNKKHVIKKPKLYHDFQVETKNASSK